MTPTILVNGAAIAHISVLDRGLQYGDGLFETLAVIGGAPQQWDDHMARMRWGCEKLLLPPPDSAQLLEETLAICQPQEARGVVKIVWTRGLGQRGYRWSAPVCPTRIVSWHTWPQYAPECWQRGVSVRVCDMRLSQNAQLAGIKHLNRLEQVLARSEWHDTAIAEGLMLDSDHWLIEGTMTNVFLVRAGNLLTPDLEKSGVCGIARERILAQAAKLGYKTRTCRLSIDDLCSSDEAFLCNSLIGIWPIKCLLGEQTRTFESVAVAHTVAKALFNNLA